MGTRWVLNHLKDLVGSSVPWLEVPIRSVSDPTDGGFFEYLLVTAKHKHSSDGNGPEKRNRFVKWMLARARRSPLKMFVLALDEAHLLPPMALEWLLNLDNELDREQCRLFVLLVGNDDLLKMQEECLEKTNGEQFTERFMSTDFRFTGLTSEDDLRQVLGAFDRTEYPYGSGKNFTWNYLPALVAAQFNLSELAPAMWQVLSNIWSEHLKGQPIQVPMAHMTRALVLLLNSVAEEGGRERPTPPQIESAVERCNFERHVITRKMSDKAGSKGRRSTWGARI